jgi:tetratricopeptide (TPR) repeat protein
MSSIELKGVEVFVARPERGWLICGRPPNLFMQTYLWLVKDGKGIESSQEVIAESAQEARLRLEEGGYCDLRLVKDDIMAEINAKSDALSVMSAADQVKLYRAGKTTFGKYLFKVAKDVAWVAAICGLSIWYSWNRRDHSRLLLFHGGAFVLVLLWVAAVRLNTFLFARMIELCEWHRADDVLRLLRVMDVMKRATAVGMKPEDAARYRSRALVWKGRFDEGVAEWQRHQACFKPWTYAAHLGGLYEHAGDVDRGLLLAEQAVKLNPKIGAYMVDLAWKYLLHDRDLARAKEAMDAAEKLEMAELAKPFVIRNRGIIAMREGKLDEAEKLLEQALAIWHADVGRHFRYSNLMLTKGYLCQTRARVGKADQARKDFAECKPWLQAAEMKMMLAGCEAQFVTGEAP